MRSRVLTLAILLQALPVAAVAQSGPPTIAVFDVETKGVALPLGVIDSLSDYVATRMTESGKYQAVPRDTLKARLIEQKKSSYKQCYDQSCQIELGREMAAHKTLATRVAKLGGECRVSMNVYDLLKAASEAAATGSGACTEAGIFAALDEALTRMLGGAQPPARERAAVAQTQAQGAAPAAPRMLSSGERRRFWDIGCRTMMASCDNTGYYAINGYGNFALTAVLNEFLPSLGEVVERDNTDDTFYRRLRQLARAPLWGASEPFRHLRREAIEWLAGILLPPPDESLCGVTARDMYLRCLSTPVRAFALAYLFHVRQKTDTWFDGYRYGAEWTGQSRAEVECKRFHEGTKSGDATSLLDIEACEFWFRRQLDGTRDAVAKVLATFLKEYDDRFWHVHAAEFEAAGKRR